MRGDCRQVHGRRVEKRCAEEQGDVPGCLVRGKGRGDVAVFTGVNGVPCRGCPGDPAVDPVAADLKILDPAGRLGRAANALDRAEDGLMIVIDHQLRAAEIVFGPLNDRGHSVRIAGMKWAASVPGRERSGRQQLDPGAALRQPGISGVCGANNEL